MTDARDREITRLRRRLRENRSLLADALGELAARPAAAADAEPEFTDAEIRHMHAQFAPPTGEACPDCGRIHPGPCQTCVLPGAFVGAYVPSVIENVTIGDEVIGVDGRAHVVSNAVSHPYNGHVKTVKARGTLPVTVTDEHQFLVFPVLDKRPARSGWAWRQRAAPADEHPVWKRADELEVGDWTVSPLPQFGGPKLPERWASPDACWLLGLIVGDGWTHKRGDKRYSLGCASSRPENVERIVAVLEGFGLRIRVRDQPGCQVVTACSREYAEEVYGFVGGIASTKHLPPFAFSSKETLMAILEGLMAADGTDLHPKRTPDRTSRRLFTISETLAWQTWSAALALGEKPFVRRVFRKPDHGMGNAKNAYTVEWLDGSRQFTARTDSFYAMPITRITDAPYEGVVHDLTVQDVHTFAINGLLTHNCGGVHGRACPRVRSIEYTTQGDKILIRRVEYWPDGRWDTSGIMFADQLPPLPGETPEDT